MKFVLTNVENVANQFLPQLVRSRLLMPIQLATSQQWYVLLFFLVGQIPTLRKFWVNIFILIRRRPFFYVRRSNPMKQSKMLHTQNLAQVHVLGSKQERASWIGQCVECCSCGERALFQAGATRPIHDGTPSSRRDLPRPPGRPPIAP